MQEAKRKRKTGRERRRSIHEAEAETGKQSMQNCGH